MKNFLKFAVSVIMLCVVATFSAAPFSCKMTEEGVKVMKGDLSSPKITSWKVTGSDSIEMFFSEKVKMNKVVIYKASDTENSDTFSAIAEFSEDGKIAVVKSQAELNVGERYELYGEIEDVVGNTLTFAIPFLGYNSRVPKIVIFAVHPKYTSSKRAGETVYKNEFVELYVATAGNLAGLQIMSAADGEAKSFVLPPIEVAAGTFVTAHMRIRGEGCVSEMPDNLRLCKQEYASDTSLDLWSANTASCLGDVADVITIQNVADGTIIDAVAYAPSGNDAWTTETLRVAAEKAVAACAWNSSSPKNAVCSDEVTPSKMIVRIDGKQLVKGELETGNNKNWTTMQVISGSGKKRVSNLGKFVTIDN